MGRMRHLTAAERLEEKLRLFAELDAGPLPLSEVVTRLRRITGLSQIAFAHRIARISPQALARIEQGSANPTVETLNQIGRAFGLQVGFVRRREE